jgi:hypothetical protein
MIVGGGKNNSGRRERPARLEPKDDRSGIVVGRKALPTVAPRKLKLPAPTDRASADSTPEENTDPPPDDPASPITKPSD